MGRLASCLVVIVAAWMPARGEACSHPFGTGDPVVVAPADHEGGVPRNVWITVLWKDPPPGKCQDGLSDDFVLRKTNGDPVNAEVHCDGGWGYSYGFTDTFSIRPAGLDANTTYTILGPRFPTGTVELATFTTGDEDDHQAPGAPALDLTLDPPRDCDFRHAVEGLTCCALDQNVVQLGRIVAPLDMTYTVTEGASILAVDSPAPLGIQVHCRDYLNDYEFGGTMPVFVGAGAHELTVVAHDRAHNAAPAVMLSFTADCTPSTPDAGPATSSDGCTVAGGPGGGLLVLLFTLLATRPLPRSSRPAPPRRTCRR